jgi:hypothetical protein
MSTVSPTAHDTIQSFSHFVGCLGRKSKGKHASICVRLKEPGSPKREDEGLS